jgi:hypothetical protein
MVPVCPSDMVKVPGRNVCIDKYEWPNKKGVNPMVGISGEPLYLNKASEKLTAPHLCKSVGKRMCSVNDWIKACEGPGGTKYPFGDTLPDKRYTTPENAPCNYAQWYRGRNEKKIMRRDKGEFARLWQGDPSGTRGCVSASGAEDMMGNVEEWVTCWKRDARGRMTRRSMCLMGRFWSEPYTCRQIIKGHDPKYFDYETGTRCCKEPMLIPDLPGVDSLEAAPLPNPDGDIPILTPFLNGILEPVIPVIEPVYPLQWILPLDMRYEQPSEGFLVAHLSIGVFP